MEAPPAVRPLKVIPVVRDLPAERGVEVRRQPDLRLRRAGAGGVARHPLDAPGGCLGGALDAAGGGGAGQRQVGGFSPSHPPAVLGGLHLEGVAGTGDLRPGPVVGAGHLTHGLLPDVSGLVKHGLVVEARPAPDDVRAGGVRHGAVVGR